MSFVDGQEALHGLQLDDQFGVHDEVHVVVAFEPDALVADGQGLLTLEIQAPQRQLVRQASTAKVFCVALLCALTANLVTHAAALLA